MKIPFKSIILMLAITVASGSVSMAGTNPIEVKDIKDKNLFVFKTNKKFLGASVEVLHSNGEVVTAQVLGKRKMIIDFSDVKEGSYTIRVTKGKHIEEFKYSKK